MGKPSRHGEGAATERFRLEGRSQSFDPRVDAIRPDLADVALASRHFAPHYAKAVARSCVVARTPVRANADADSEMVSELLFGEGFALLDITGGWAWGYCLHDHYVGYVPEDTLGAYVEPAFRLIAPATVTGADGQPLALPVGALLGDAGSVPVEAIAALDTKADDAVATAEAMFDTPYLWGGRSNEGIDCSGLIQTMLARAGIAAPRDSDQQLGGLTGDIDLAAPYQRGDILYFPDHVGVMIDDKILLHATQHYGKVVKEALADVVARIESEGHSPAIIGRKRLLAG